MLFSFCFTLCCRLQLYSSDFRICSSSCLQCSFWLDSLSANTSFLCLALFSCFTVAADSTSTVWVTYWQKGIEIQIQRLCLPRIKTEVVIPLQIQQGMANFTADWCYSNASFQTTFKYPVAWFTFTTGSFPFSLSSSSCSSLILSSRFLSSSALLHSLCSLLLSSCETCSARCCRELSSCCTLLRRFSFSCHTKLAAGMSKSVFINTCSMPLTLMSMLLDWEGMVESCCRRPCVTLRLCFKLSFSADRHSTRFSESVAPWQETYDSAPEHQLEVNQE